MKKKMVRLFCIMVAVLMSFSLAACSQKSNTDPTEKQTGSMASEGTAASKEPEVIKIHVLGAHGGWTGPDRENPIRDEIMKRTGIDVDYETWQYAGQDEYQQRLNMWIASNEFPCDVFLGDNSVFSVTLFNSLGEKGDLWELDGFVERHPSFKDFAANTFPKYRNANNGKLYGYPYHINNPDFFNVKDVGISLRIDWMKQLGYDYPKSPEEYYNLLKDMKDKIKTPDGSAVIPLSLADNGKGIDRLGAQFLGEYDMWAKDTSGKYGIPLYSSYDRTIKFVVFMNKLWREGLMDKESFTQKRAQLIEKAANGIVGSSARIGHADQAQVNDLLWKENKDSLMAFMPSFPDEGIEKAAVQKCTPWGGGYTVFPKRTPEEKVEAYFRLAEFVLTEEGTILTFMGIEGQHWEKDASGKSKFTNDFIEKYPTENERQKFGLWLYQSSAADWFRIDQYAAIKPEYLRPDYIANIENMNDKYVMDDIVHGTFPGEIEQQKLPAINEAWTQVLIKSIMSNSEEECRKILSDFPNTLNKLGYEEIVKEKNEIVKKISQ